MVTSYKLMKWAFSNTRFSDVLFLWVSNFSMKEVAEMLGVSKSTVNNWMNGNFSEEFPHPNMSNFLVFCNETDSDPRDFFVLEDAE
jgi:transcriptional regulator with XRE-family HTH domain